MKGGIVIPTWIVLVAVAFIAGAIAGCCGRMYSEDGKRNAAIAGFYLAQTARTEKDTERCIAELEQYREQLRHRRCDRTSMKQKKEK